MGLHFAVIYGSVRRARQGIKYARFLNTQLDARGHDVSFVDRREDAVDRQLARVRLGERE